MGWLCGVSFWGNEPKQEQTSEEIGGGVREEGTMLHEGMVEPHSSLPMDSSFVPPAG